MIPTPVMAATAALGLDRRPSGRVVVLNGVRPDEDASPALLMMVLVGGRDRTLGEFRELAREAGLEVRAAARQPSGRFVVECCLT